MGDHESYWTCDHNWALWKDFEYDCKQEITRLSALQLQQLQGQRPI